MPSSQPTTDPPVTDWPLYWFARLDKAVEQGDHQAASDAQRQLARLGVRVNYGRPRRADPTPEGEGAADAR